MSEDSPNKPYEVFNNLTREEALVLVKRDREGRLPTAGHVNAYYDSFLPATKPPQRSGPS